MRTDHFRHAIVTSNRTEPSTRVLVVGLGQAGARFVRACIALNTTCGSVMIVGGVDVGDERRRSFERSLPFPCFDSIDALADANVSADIAIVTVPEIHHFGVLTQLKRALPTLRRILCEKPLAANADEARNLTRLYADFDVSVNFVERFSPIVAELRSFMKQRGRRVLRANCFWGKYRVKDARPTPGVIAVELAHPLDLILLLGGIRPGTPYSITAAIASRSNFDVGTVDRYPLDTVHVALEFTGGLQVMASSSLLWSARERRIELTLVDDDGVATELAVLSFDKPIWDLDRLDIYDLQSRGGKPDRIGGMETTAASWPAERLTIGKVCGFLEANLAELAGRRCSQLLPRLTQGVYVQEIMEAVEAAATSNAMSVDCYVQPRESGAPSPSAQVRFLGRIAQGASVEEQEYIWDHPY